MFGRLPNEFRDRTKRYAAATIRLFVKLPKQREEVKTLGKRDYSGVGQTSGLPVRGASGSVSLVGARLGARGPSNRQTGGLPHASPPEQLQTREEVRVLGRQLLRSGTSVAAHVREASRARSDEEFASKLGGAVQEADESQLWLELLREECAIPLTGPLEKEADELIAIMTTMIKKTKDKS